MPLASLQSLHALYPQIAVYFGEVSVANFNANTPEVKRRIESTRYYVEQAYVPGVNFYTLDDYTAPGGTGTGIFDQSRQRAGEHERTRSGRSRGAPGTPARRVSAHHAGEPVPAGQTTLQSSRRAVPAEGVVLLDDAR
jgi:hypothetical protein